jgi:hypothetical protein
LVPFGSLWTSSKLFKKKQDGNFKRNLKEIKSKSAVMTALSVLFLSSLTVSLCDLCKTVLSGLGLWVIYNSF